MTSPLDWFATGYCIAHSDTTSSWSVQFGSIASTPSPRCLQAFSSGLHYSSTTTHRSGGTGSLTEMILILFCTSPVSPYLETFPSLFPYSQAITKLQLYGCVLCSDDRGVPVLQQLSHYCPRLRELLLPSLHPPYLSLVPQLPQHTLDTLTLPLPLMKDDCVLGHHLQQCLALKHLHLYGPEDKLVMMIHSLYDDFPILLISGFFKQYACNFCGRVAIGSKGMSVFMDKPTVYCQRTLLTTKNCTLFKETLNQQYNKSVLVVVMVTVVHML